MGARGPAPKPTNLKLVQGTISRGQAARKNEPKPKVEAPQPPADMSPEARAEWDRVVPDLLRLGVLTRIDRAALVAYCECWSLFWRSKLVVDEEGATFTTEKGYVGQRPEVSIANKALSQMRAYLIQFGLTPSSRSRVEGSAEPVDDEKDYLFGE